MTDIAENSKQLGIIGNSLLLKAFSTAPDMEKLRSPLSKVSQSDEATKETSNSASQIVLPDSNFGAMTPDRNDCAGEKASSVISGDDGDFSVDSADFPTIPRDPIRNSVIKDSKGIQDAQNSLQGFLFQLQNQDDISQSSFESQMSGATGNSWGIREESTPGFSRTLIEDDFVQKDESTALERRKARFARQMSSPNLQLGTDDKIHEPKLCRRNSEIRMQISPQMSKLPTPQVRKARSTSLILQSFSTRKNAVDPKEAPGEPEWSVCESTFAVRRGSRTELLTKEIIKPLFSHDGVRTGNLKKRSEQVSRTDPAVQDLEQPCANGELLCQKSFKVSESKSRPRQVSKTRSISLIRSDSKRSMKLNKNDSIDEAAMPERQPNPLARRLSRSELLTKEASKRSFIEDTAHAGNAKTSNAVAGEAKQSKFLLRLHQDVNEMGFPTKKSDSAEIRSASKRRMKKILSGTADEPGPVSQSNPPISRGLQAELLTKQISKRSFLQDAAGSGGAKATNVVTDGSKMPTPFHEGQEVKQEEEMEISSARGESQPQQHTKTRSDSIIRSASKRSMKVNEKNTLGEPAVPARKSTFLARSGSRTELLMREVSQRSCVHDMTPAVTATIRNVLSEAEKSELAAQKRSRKARAKVIEGRKQRSNSYIRSASKRTLKSENKQEHCEHTEPPCQPIKSMVRSGSHKDLLKSDIIEESSLQCNTRSENLKPKDIPCVEGTLESIPQSVSLETEHMKVEGQKYKCDPTPPSRARSSRSAKSEDTENDRTKSRKKLSRSGSSRKLSSGRNRAALSRSFLRSASRTKVDDGLQGSFRVKSSIRVGSKRDLFSESCDECPKSKAIMQVMKF